MKKTVLQLFLLPFILLLWQGCSPDAPAPERIGKAGDVVFGSVVIPPDGSGHLFYHGKSLLPEFPRVQIEVLPVEHRVWRISFEALELPGSGDELRIAADIISRHYPVKFTASGNDSMRADLPQTSVILKRAFHLGPRCVTAEFIDLAGAKRAAELKKSAEFQQQEKFRNARRELATVAHAIESYILDTSTAPEKLDGLVKKPQDSPAWNGPYLSGNNTVLLQNCIYRKKSASTYELYTIVDGKRITEDF